jgi:glucose/arabinose dehydrogenase
VYLYYSDAASGNNVLVRVRDRNGRAGETEALRSFLPWSTGYHNGGDLLFGPDGMLYASVGEAHAPEHAQDPQDEGGKILRLTPRGAVPSDNPFGGSAAFTIGHRNSFGLCLDPATGDIWQTENGPDVDDEVNLLRAGENYGWPEVTGDSDGRFADPVAIFPSPEALTGCAVWRRALWFGAANTGTVYRMPLDGPDTTPREAATFDAPVVDVTVGPDDALWVATAAAIVRLRDDGPDPTATPSPTATPTDGVSPTERDPVVMPERDAPVARTSPLVPLVAAVLIGAALLVRLRVGRSLRRDLRGDDGDGDDGRG